MKRDKVVIGSRGSKLALIYAENVKTKLKEVFSKDIEIKKIITSGDENQKDRISNLGGKGLFSKKIENELIENKIDIAVHALKDMPSIETDGLETNYSSYSPEVSSNLSNIAKDLSLLESGGTDYHGENRPNINIGFGYENKPLKIPYEFLSKMKEKHAAV